MIRVTLAALGLALAVPAWPSAPAATLARPPASAAPAATPARTLASNAVGVPALALTPGLAPPAPNSVATSGAPVPTPVLDIPVLSDAKVLNEVYLTNNDLLPMLKQSLGVLGGGGPPLPGFLAVLNKLDFTGLSEAIKDLQAVKGCFYNVAGVRDASKVTDFYTDVLEKDRWTRTLLMNPDDTTSITVYSQGAQAMFGVMAKSDGGLVHVTAFRTQGMVDLPRLLAWGRSAAATVSAVMDAHNEGPLTPAPAALPYPRRLAVPRSPEGNERVRR